MVDNGVVGILIVNTVVVISVIVIVIIVMFSLPLLLLSLPLLLSLLPLLSLLLRLSLLSLSLLTWLFLALLFFDNSNGWPLSLSSLSLLLYHCWRYGHFYCQCCDGH